MKPIFGEGVLCASEQDEIYSLFSEREDIYSGQSLFSFATFGLISSVGYDNLRRHHQVTVNQKCQVNLSNTNSWRISPEDSMDIPPILRLPDELLLRIAEILLQNGESHVSHMSLTCRSLYQPAVSVLYRSFSLIFDGDTISTLDPPNKPRLPISISSQNGALVRNLIAPSFVIVTLWMYDFLFLKEVIPEIAALKKCRSLRHLQLVESKIGLACINSSCFDDKPLFSGPWLDQPFANVTDLTFVLALPCSQDWKYTVLRFFPSLRTLELKWPTHYLSTSGSNSVGGGHRSLVQEIESLAMYCPLLEQWKLPIWNPAFAHRNVCTALSKLPSLRRLVFHRQWQRMNTPDCDNIENYVGFRLYLQNHTRITVVDLEPMLYLSLGDRLQSVHGNAETIVEYLMDRLSHDHMLQLKAKTTDFGTTVSRTLNQYPILEQQEFRTPKLVNLRLIGNTPLSTDRLPRVITSLTFQITHLTSFNHWLPQLYQYVASPFLRSLSLRFHHAIFADFPLYVTPPEDTGETKRFEMCLWKRPIAAPSGFEAVQYHHQWRYFTTNTKLYNHDESLGMPFIWIDAADNPFYEWPDDEGEIDIMEKYGLDMVYAVPFEKYLVDLADCSAYVAFHLDVQIVNRPHMF